MGFGADERFSFRNVLYALRRTHVAPAKQVGPATWEAAGWAPGRFDLMLDRLSYNLQQVFPPEGFGEKTRCTPSQGFFAIGLSSLGSDEYNRHTIIGFRQFVLKFQAVYARQVHIENQAGGILRGCRH